MATRIFLVEDHPVMREAYADVLGLESDLELCGVTETAEACLDALPETPADVVVTDLSLPGMDGIALTERLRAERPEIPVIVISAHAAEDYRERAVGAGARAYVHKSDLTRRLVPLIRELMGGQGAA